MRKVAGIAGLDFSRFENLCTDATQRNSSDNLAYLQESLVLDVARIDAKLELFEHASQTQREALNQLVSEAVVRTAEAKSRDRVKRISRILANAFRSGPKDDYELERELIDTAISVSEADASVLGVMMKYQGDIVRSGSASPM